MLINLINRTHLRWKLCLFMWYRFCTILSKVFLCLKFLLLLYNTRILIICFYSLGYKTCHIRIFIKWFLKFFLTFFIKWFVSLLKRIICVVEMLSWMYTSIFILIFHEKILDISFNIHLLCLLIILIFNFKYKVFHFC